MMGILIAIEDTIKDRCGSVRRDRTLWTLLSPMGRLASISRDQTARGDLIDPWTRAPTALVAPKNAIRTPTRENISSIANQGLKIKSVPRAREAAPNIMEIYPMKGLDPSFLCLSM